MTAKPTISYGHGFLEDCSKDHLTIWDKYQDGQTMSDLVNVNDDIFDMESTGSSGNKDGYFQNHTAINKSAAAYPLARVRYKVSGAATFRFEIEFVGGAQQISTDYSETTWTTRTFPITGGTTIEYVRLHNHSGVGHVYIDFVDIYKGDFTIPNTALGLSIVLPARYGRLSIPNARGGATQSFGSEVAEVIINSELDIGTWLRGAETVAGEVFYDIIHNSDTEDFQWFDSGDLGAKFKVTVETAEFKNEARGSVATHTLVVTMYEYRRGPANDESAAERWGLPS